jgi:protein-S-isoprenylcysteine O-methyltransferase Ste14
MVAVEVYVRLTGEASPFDRLRGIRGVGGVKPSREGATLLVEASDIRELVEAARSIRGVGGVAEVRVGFPREFTRRGSRAVALAMYVAYPLLCVLPTASALAGLGLGPLGNGLELPPPAVAASVAVIAAFYVLAGYANYLRVSRGGCSSSEDTVFLVKEGPYAVVRHPSTLGGLALILLLPVALSGLIRFTALTVLGQTVAFCAVALIQVPREEAFCVEKWGEEYIDYARGVPRFNIFLGLIRLAMRGRRWARAKI